VAVKKTKQRPPNYSCELIAVGASAGGLLALSRVLTDIDPDFPAIVIVQHLDPGHKSQMAGLLSRKTRKRVKDAEDGEAVRGDTIYIGPANEHLLVRDGRIQLAHSRLVRFSRPSIDVMFASVAAMYGDRAMGVILSGSNRDGSDGIAAIKRAGGATVAQDPTTAEFRTMPQSAIDTGCVDYVLSLDTMGQTISRLLRNDSRWQGKST
jgi:two-component system, chemotaxis family, protein-glutamate methylesterase/glutaminase